MNIQVGTLAIAKRDRAYACGRISRAEVSFNFRFLCQPQNSSNMTCAGDALEEKNEKQSAFTMTVIR